jgi:Ca2+-binding RTX toxin-like protein
MRGGDGRDTIVANAGHGEDGSPDVLEGNGGNDLLDAPDGRPNDLLNGGPDRDRCRRDPGEPTSECESFS